MLSCMLCFVTDLFLIMCLMTPCCHACYVLYWFIYNYVFDDTMLSCMLCFVTDLFLIICVWWHHVVMHVMFCYWFILFVIICVWWHHVVMHVMFCYWFICNYVFDDTMLSCMLCFVTDLFVIMCLMTPCCHACYVLLLIYF